MKFTDAIPYSYNGTVLNSSDYQASIPWRTPALAETDIQETMRNEDYPVYGGKLFRSRELNVTIKIMGSGSIQTLQNLFDTSQIDLAKFIVKDRGDSDKQYYVYATPIAFTSNGKLVIVKLHVPDPVWKANTATTTSWSATSTPVSQVVASGGSYFCRPRIQLTPKTSKSGEYDYRRWVKIYNQTSNAAKNYPIDVLGGNLDHAALVTAGKSQADGDDFRVIMNGAEKESWEAGGGFNSTTLRLFINIDLSPKQETTLKTAIASSGTLTTIDLALSLESKNLIRAINSRLIKMVEIDSEIFTVTSTNEALCQLTGTISRAQRDTSMAAHTVGDTVRWIEHDIYVIYGKATAAYTTYARNNAKRQPMIVLASSTNTSWVFTDYFDEDYPARPATWKPRVIQSKYAQYGGDSNYYTANHNTNVTSGAASEMGLRIEAFQGAYNNWMTEQAELEWLFTCPFESITTVTTSGEVYTKVTSWPAATLEKYKYGLWTNVWSQSVPTANTWTAFGPTASALSGYYGKVRYHLKGSVNGSASNYAAMECDSITIAKSSTYVPSVTLGAETSQYMIDATITNSTSDQGISVFGVMSLDDVLIIDCENQYITLNGHRVPTSWITISTTRKEWMRLANGNNTIVYAETGLARVDIDFVYNGRSL